MGKELERRNVRRALIVPARPLEVKLLDIVKNAAGPAWRHLYGAVQHVPSATVDALAHMAREIGADSFISFGGGSPNDSAKVAAMRLLAEKPPGAEIPHLAIPTTLSAGEFTPFGGITDEEKREKGGVGDPRLQAKVVILDPELTRETPAWLWASTGMRALDHAVESAYSSRHQPLTDVLSARAIALLVAHLRPSLATTGEEELEHRLQCQIAAWFSIFGAMNTGLGVSHALGHQIGPYWDVPHGVTSCITLPHVMRFMAGIAPDRFTPIAEGFGVHFDVAHSGPAALECADCAARFIAQFEVPTRLRDVGAPREELGRIAGAVLNELGHANVVGRPITSADVMGLLEAATDFARNLGVARWCAVTSHCSVGTLAICAFGCGTSNELPTEPPNTTYQVTMDQMYTAGEPAGLMTISHDKKGTPTHGAITGKIHGWPFAHTDKSGDSGEGLFSYRTEFTVTSAGSDKMPVEAEGTRTVYFHPDRLPMSLDQIGALASGQAVIRDQVTLRFSFQNSEAVNIGMSSRQVWTQSFAWNQTVVTPPDEPPATAM